MAGYTYYSRLTLVHPKDVNKLDPSLGRILCETATTGKFILSEVSWDSHVAPNAQTSIAYNTNGEMKIHEPLGVRFLDYIRFAALEVGLMNHLDARYLLEVEIVSETLPKDNNSFRFVWPIMIIASEVKTSVNEKGAEYNIKFAHTGHHAQTDMVQPLKETKTVNSVSTIEEYFKGFGRLLELEEFIRADAGQKAGSGGSPGGDHPAASDPFHDEYHFILDPRIKDYHISENFNEDKAVQAEWFQNIFRFTNRFDVSAKGGTTIISQIQRVLASTEESAALYLTEFNAGAGPSGSQSSEANKATLRGLLGKVYNFFRVETHSVYKSFDYIRGRYAVKHVFLIWLALEPNMYQYPDEIDELNKPNNKEKVISKLKRYIQDGLLQRAYYYQYTGLNTEILKFDIQLNQMYYLPSFPVVWSERGTTGPGEIGPQNFSRQVLPFGRYKNDRNERLRLAQEQQALREQEARLPTIKSEDARKALQATILEAKRELSRRQAELDASGNGTSTNVNGTQDRASFLSSLSNLYIEDVDYTSSLEIASSLTPAHRPRMEPDEPTSMLAEKNDENQALTDKIMAVMLSARDLMELDMDIKGDPYWLGMPHLCHSKNDLSKLGLPPAMEQEINATLPNIDPDWGVFPPASWGTYDTAKYYRGGALFYLNSQLPTQDVTEDDLMKFSEIDQVIGIYKMLRVKNIFKNGQWVQSVHAVRDLTIPSQFIPRASIGEQGWEDFAAAAIAEAGNSTGTGSTSNESRSPQTSNTNPAPAEPPATVTGRLNTVEEVERTIGVVPVGRVSSARAPGVMGSIEVGSETNALDVISEENRLFGRN